MLCDLNGVGCEQIVEVGSNESENLLESGLAAQSLDDITVSLVTPGGAMLHQAQHCLKMAIGSSRLHCCP